MTCSARSARPLPAARRRLRGPVHQPERHNLGHAGRRRGRSCRHRVLCPQRWASFHYCSSGRVWWTRTSIGCGSVWSASAASGYGAVDRLAIFVAVALVVSSTALMLGYRTRSVVVPAARPNDPMAPYRTRVMRRSRLFGGASRPQLMCCAVFVLRSSTRSRRCAASSTWRWWTAPSPNPSISIASPPTSM